MNHLERVENDSHYIHAVNATAWWLKS